MITYKSKMICARRPHQNGFSGGIIRLRKTLFGQLGLGTIAGLLATITASAGEATSASVLDEVQLRVGTAEHGHTFPGACLPFGLVQLSPDTRNDTWDGASGYHDSDTVILGFSHRHFDGTGIPDQGDILLMPAVGDVNLVLAQPKKAKKAGPKGSDVSAVGYDAPKESGFATAFTHDQETMCPGYYRVNFPEKKMTAELTTTIRCGFHRYTFPVSEQSHVLFDLGHGLHYKALESGLTVENDHVISGFRRHKGFSDEQTCYFVAEFSKPFGKVSASVNNAAVSAGQQFHGVSVRAQVDFATTENEIILIKVGISPVSVEGARKNLAAEIPDFAFDKVLAAAKETWRQQLLGLDVRMSDRNNLQTFYSALYHSCVAPNIASDVDGAFFGPDGKNHPPPGFTFYTNFSLWDIFRAEIPLLIVLEPQRMEDAIKTFLTHYEVFGHHCLPVMPYGARESWAMIGYPVTAAIGDAYAKGIRGFDTKLALQAMLDTMNFSEPQLAEYRKLGYVPRGPYYDGFGSEPLRHKKQSVSRTLEFAYEDACVARFAAALGQADTAKANAKRAQSWRKVFDPKTGFMRGKTADGQFPDPFNPRDINFDDYTEATAWHYLFFVPHDVSGLIQTMGGDQVLIQKLDKMFDSSSDMTGFWMDVTGLIGQYAHGNEPCHHAAYMYNYAGAPWKTQRRVRSIMSILYDNTPAGLCGNDDCGQMSAWYVWSALGMYPVDPMSGVYVIGSPLVDSATIRLDPKYATGRTFTITTKNNSDENVYIQSAMLNGKPLTRSWISHKELMAGGELVFEMGPLPNKNWGAAPQDRPPSAMP